MNRFFLVVCCFAVSAVSVFAQGPNDPNHGSQLTYNGAAGSFSFKWWGQAGKSYFIQQTDDLLTSWHYLPVVGTGLDDILALGFTAPNSSKLFLRLEYMTYDPYTYDSDGDGMPDAYEILNYLDHKVANGTLDFDGDGVPNREDARPANPSVGRLSISITAPGNGASLP